MTIAEKVTRAKKDLDDAYMAGKVSVEGEYAGWYDTFWDSYQDNGNRTDYAYAFSYGWKDEMFSPKYDLVIENAAAMFAQGNITDLVGLLEQSGVTFDTSNCTTFLQFAQGSELTKIPVIDASKATNMNYAFYRVTITDIEKLIVSENTPFNSSNTFAGGLTNIIFEGTIGQSGLSIKSTTLSKASIESIINCLSTTTTGLSITLSKTAVNTAFGVDVDDVTTYPEGSEYYTLRHSRDNWTINYV